MADSPSQTQAPAGVTLGRGTESLFDLARGVLQDLPGLIGDRVELFSLELHRAGIALVKVVALTVVATAAGVPAMPASSTAAAASHWRRFPE